MTVNELQDELIILQIKTRLEKEIQKRVRQEAVYVILL